MKNTALLRRCILSRRSSVGVVGLNYVGVSLACAAANAGFTVVGIEREEERLGLANSLSVPGTRAEEIRDTLATGRLTFSSEATALSTCDVVCICAPTFARDRRPDVSILEEACSVVAERLASGRLIILESSPYAGATEQVVAPILERSGLSAGRDFLLACSPERLDPGGSEYELRNIPRIVGGLTPESTGLATLFYEQVVEKVVAVSSCRVAELTRLLELTFRRVNVALVNEMAILCHSAGIDVWEVLEAAASKPFGFMPFTPGPGVGGDDAWLDPAALSPSPRRNGVRHLRMLEEAQTINAQMPAHVASRIGDALNQRGRALKGANLFVLGVAYKADIADVRESPALKVIETLTSSGAKVSFHDPHIRLLSIDDKVRERTELTQRAVARADCVALLTPHRSYDLQWIARHSSLIFDARNGYGSRRPANVITL